MRASAPVVPRQGYDSEDENGTTSRVTYSHGSVTLNPGARPLPLPHIVVNICGAINSGMFPYMLVSEPHAVRRTVGIVLGSRRGIAATSSQVRGRR